jgi:hypothetical protein
MVTGRGAMCAGGSSPRPGGAWPGGAALRLNRGDPGVGLRPLSAAPTKPAVQISDADRIKAQDPDHRQMHHDPQETAGKRQVPPGRSV